MTKLQRPFNVPWDFFQNEKNKPCKMHTSILQGRENTKFCTTKFWDLNKKHKYVISRN